MPKYLSKAACYRVAKEAYEDVKFVTAYIEKKSGLEECGICLFIYANERWVIDEVDYLTDHRNIASAVSLAHYNSIEELAAEIDMQQNYC